MCDWSSTPQKEEKAELDRWKRCPQHKAGRGRSLRTLRENNFLSLWPSWEAQETPASWLLYPCWEEAWQFLCWDKSGGTLLGTSILMDHSGGGHMPLTIPHHQWHAVVLCSWARAHGGWPASLCGHGSAPQCTQALFSLFWDSIMVQVESVKGLTTSKSYQQRLTSIPNPQQHSALGAQDKGENIHGHNIKISVACSWAELVNTLWKWWAERIQEGKGGEEREEIMLQLFCGVYLGHNRRAEMCRSNPITKEINRMLWKYLMSTEKREIGLVCCR